MPRRTAISAPYRNRYRFEEVQDGDRKHNIAIADPFLLTPSELVFALQQNKDDHIQVLEPVLPEDLVKYGFPANFSAFYIVRLARPTAPADFRQRFNSAVTFARAP